MWVLQLTYNTISHKGLKPPNYTKSVRLDVTNEKKKNDGNWRDAWSISILFYYELEELVHILKINQSVVDNIV